MLIDHAILGSGDWHMASALVGQVQRSLYSGYSTAYIRLCREWQGRAEKYIPRHVGYLPRLVNHLFSRAKQNRAYDHRWKFLAQSGDDPPLPFNPDCHRLFSPP